jgi:hypothetical protein
MAQEDKMIDYLSKEIETQTNVLMKFREKVSFAVFVNPLVVVVPLWGKGLPQIRWDDLSRYAWIGIALSLVLVMLSYLVLGVAYSLIEIQIWRQCNKWRERVSEISMGHDKGFKYDDLSYPARIKRAYLWVYGALLLGFIAALNIVMILRPYS